MYGELRFDAQLLRRHDRPGPRYTSYPTVPQFGPGFGVAELAAQAARGNSPQVRRPLSLYAHVPFCYSPCFYCGCTRLITRDSSRGVEYARRLAREIELVARLFSREREVVQLHLGGGTPNFLAAQSLGPLMELIGRTLNLSSDAQRDFSIELDPRSVPPGYAAALAGFGFNRVSLGVQDFDPEVQRAVNRVQGVEETLQLIDDCRDSGFRSVNVDLIYGLPRQTPEAFGRTLRTVMSARPDRLAIYGYAHLPQLFKGQRRIEAADLPTPETRLMLLQLAIEELTGAGYRYIGMDHFALPEDELVRAQEAGTLQRNFMGYTTHADSDLIGVGVSAISHVGDSFSQNYRDLKQWEAAIDAGRLPLYRGLALSADDLVRAAVIGQLMCQGEIDVRDIERRFGIDFGAYFAQSLAQLAPHAEDGLVRLGEERIEVTPEGRLLLRSLAMCFDAYLQVPRAPAERPAYSKVV